MNSIVPANGAGGAVVVPDDSNPYLAYGNAATQQRLVGDMMKFSKGDFVAGLDQREIPLGTRFAANMAALMVGWLLWEDNKPAEQLMGLISDGFRPARRADLGHTDKELWELDDQGVPQDPWQLSNYLILKDENGTLYTFVTSSTGGRQAIGELCKVYGKEMRQHPGMCPIIELDAGKYKHSNPRYGWIKFPKFKVTGWVPQAIFDEDPPRDGDPTGEVDDDEAMEQVAQQQMALAGAPAQSAPFDAGPIPEHLRRTAAPAAGDHFQQQPGPDPAVAAAQQAAAPKPRGRPRKDASAQAAAAPAAQAAAAPAPARDAFGRPASAPSTTGSTPRF